MSQPRTDYDSPWKQTIENYFMDFMEFFFPEIHADIDWSKGYEFLDKELQGIVRDAEIGKRFADKLVKVYRIGGEELFVLAHIEVQGWPEADFAKRIDTYNYRISDRYNKPVVSLAVLADGQENWRPDEYKFELWGFSKMVRFPIVKLLDYRQQWSMLENSSNPFATVVMAHLKTLETKNNQSERKEWKFNLTRRLYQQGYQRQDVLNLFWFIDWIMTLPKNLETSFRQELEVYERSMQMQYVTSIERLAKEEGQLEGAVDVIKLGLELKFGQEGLQILPEISQIADMDVLKAIQSGLLQGNTLDEIRALYQGQD